MATRENAAQFSDTLPIPNPSVITADAIDRAVANSELKATARIDGIEKAIEKFHADLTRVPTSFDRQILSLREIIETRLHCMEEDVKGVHNDLDTRGRDIKEQVTQAREFILSKIDNVTVEIEKLGAVSAERFTRVDTQFSAWNTMTDKLSLADKTAVAAALQAAKEAVGAQNTSNSIAIAKSESSTIESIRQLQNMFDSSIGAIKDSIGDVKSRLDKGEGKTSVSDPAVADGMQRLAAMMTDLSKGRDTATGQAQGVGAVWGIILGGGGLFMGLVTLIVLLRGLR